MRPSTACTTCRDRRKRCIRVGPHTRCAYCTKKGLSCSLATTRTRSDRPQGYEPLAKRRHGPVIGICPDYDLEASVADDLVGLYFKHTQTALPSLFHPGQFKAAVHDGSIPTILFLGAAGLSARFSSQAAFAEVDPWDRGRPFIEEAERLLNLHEASLVTIQACMLLAANFVANGEAQTECLYLTVACRIAMLLDLPKPKLTDTAIDQEVHCRVWWSLVTMDMWNSTASMLPRVMKPREDVRLPMDDRLFLTLPMHAEDENASSERTPALSSREPGVSLLAFFPSLNALLYEIHLHNTRSVATGETTILGCDSIRVLSKSLDDWHFHLPDLAQYTDENLAYWAEQDLGPMFVNLHMNYHYAGLLLYYPYLQFSQDLRANAAAVEAQLCAAKCKYHSGSLCELIYNANQRPETTLLHSIVGHALVVAATAQLHTLLFSSDEAEIAVAKVRLERNFEVITRLHSYWPIVQSSISRLQAFHEACMQTRNESFQLDWWMLKYILDFPRPIADKAAGLGQRDDDSTVRSSLRNLLEL